MIEEKRALVICAHDDDEVIGPGGTIRKLANAGVHISTLILATGNEGYTRLEEKDTIVARRAEERAAAQRVLGTAECFVCDFHDFENLDSEPVYRTIMETVRRVQPHLIFTHLATDYLAHRTLARVAPEAIWQAGWQCPLELGAPWSTGKVYQFSVLQTIAKPSHLVDITDTFPAKLEAMKAYRSQHEVVAGVLDQIEAKARVYGSLMGVRYAEALTRSQHIPVPVGDPDALLTGL